MIATALNSGISESKLPSRKHAELQKALEEKKIQYRAVKLKTKAKTLIAKIGLKITGWFR